MRDYPAVTLTRVAQLLRIDVKDIDLKCLHAAKRSVQFRDEDFWDAMAESGQMADNIPDSVAVVLVYNNDRRQEDELRPSGAAY